MWKVGLRLATPALSLILLLLNCLSPALGQEQPLLVVYGPKASTAEGDPDYREIIYFRVPADVMEPLYLRVFDMEIGGDNDLVYGVPGDTRTRFSLFGGAGAASVPCAIGPRFGLQPCSSKSRNWLNRRCPGPW